MRKWGLGIQPMATSVKVYWLAFLLLKDLIKQVGYFLSRINRVPVLLRKQEKAHDRDMGFGGLIQKF